MTWCRLWQLSTTQQSTYASPQVVSGRPNKESGSLRCQLSMIPVDQDPEILPDVPGCAMYCYYLIRRSGPWMRADVYGQMYLHHTAAPWQPALCLSPSPFIPPISYLKSHITTNLNRRAAQAQGIVTRPNACGRKDRQTDMPGLLAPGSWLLAPVPGSCSWLMFLFLMHEPGLAGWLAGRLRNEADLVRIPRLRTVHDRLRRH